MRLRPALAWAAALIADWAVFNVWSPGQRLMYWALVGITQVVTRASWATAVVRTASLVPAVVGVVAAAGATAARRGPAEALRALCLGAGVLAAAEAGQRVVPRAAGEWFPHWNTMPSGHTAGALAVVLAALVAATGSRRATRAVAAVGGLWLAVLVPALLGSTAHTGADVLASACIAGVAWAIAGPEVKGSARSTRMAGALCAALIVLGLALGAGAERLSLLAGLLILAASWAGMGALLAQTAGTTTSRRH